jgi:hypothetical protein
MSRLLLKLALAGALTWLTACSSVSDTRRPQEFLDDRTGATITMVGKPLVFWRDRTELAANLRDYVTLVATSVNRAGKIEYVWVSYVWSTLDPKLDGYSKVETIVMTADDRRIRLMSVAATAVEAGISVPVRAPAGIGSISRVYATDLETLRFISAARNLRLQASTDDTAPYYELWDDERASLAEFVRFAEER